jgi:hypothetical protein
VDREKAWAEKCEEVFQETETCLAEIRLLHEDAKKAVSELELSTSEEGVDRTFDFVVLIETIEAILLPQKADLEQLKCAHLCVFEVFYFNIYTPHSHTTHIIFET